MKHFYVILLIMLFCQKHAVAQQNKNLPPVLASSANEFSGMCLHDGRLYLLPQLKNATSNNAMLYSIDTNKLELLPDGTVQISAEAVMQHPIRNFSRVASGSSKYGGFEAIATVGNSVFLTVETDGDSDAIVTGAWEGQEVVLNETKMRRIPKVRKNGQLLPNAGYENLTIYDGQLLTAFEYNYKGDSTRMYLLDKNLKGTTKLLAIPPIPFRLTDVTSIGKGKLLGINVYWNFNGNMTHREAYYKEIDASTDPDLKHWKPNECFARIIEISIEGQKATWKTKKLIPANDCINWEGIVAWRDGILLISDDNKLPFLQTKLRYYSLAEKP